MQISNTPLLITPTTGFNDKKTPERLPVVIDAEPEFKLSAGSELCPTGDCSDPKTDVVATSYAAYSQQARFIRSFSTDYEPSSQSNQQQNIPLSVQQYLQIADVENGDDERGIFVDEKV